MRTRISILILLVAAVQLLVYSAVLIFGGEFRDLETSAYRGFADKAENSGTYIRNELREKPVLVQEYARQLDRAVAGVLAERGVSVAAVRTDRELDERIMEASVEIVSGLLRGSMADEAYFILDTGDLYAGEGGAAALVLLAPGPDSDSLTVAVGPAAVAQNAGFSQHDGWSPYFAPDPTDSSSADFYDRALQTARENRGLVPADLGYWSRLSKVTPALTPSMKYSLPLMAGDGTVYGVLGIGLTKDSVLSYLPAPGFLSENAFYVLGRTASNNSYDVLTYSGSAYDALLGSLRVLRVGAPVEGDVCRLDTDMDTDLVGSVRDLGLYSDSSPYAGEQWALISVADRASVLHSLLFLRRMLGVSAVLSLIVVLIITVPGCGVIIKPLTNLTKQIRTKPKYNEVIRFQPSNIYEIDEITDAITQMQINVHGFSSQVSKMISVADVGLGTFMYDRTDDSVFVGQSLIDVLKLGLPQGEDVVISRREFLSRIKNPETRSLIASGLGMADGRMREDLNDVYQINRVNGGTLWLRVGYTYSTNTAIGVVQDVTETMLEKSRIEHERDYDTLTGLLTRHAYYRRVEEVFRDRDELPITAFIMVDLDNLKYVNDTYGHAFGDDYIKTASSVLKKFESHGGIVARLSGDEFNICLPSFSSKDEVRKIIESIRAELLRSSCLMADGHHFRVGASMGVSWYPDDAESRELLMKYADFAMYTVKHSTKGGIAEFDINSYTMDSAKLADWVELNRIIEGSRVKYAFQSIVSAKTGEIYGYEALMRIQSDIFQSPLELLNTAKVNVKLHEIERLTWTRSMADFQTLINRGRIGKSAHLFINSIANHKLGDDVIASLEKTYPWLLKQVVMEILESESADETSIAHKEQLIHRWGGQLALDDYGTGYNSEYALLSFQPNIIKIDRSIISGCDQDADRRVIIENLVKLAQAKGVLVLAEGVETEGELETVISCGVDLLQGYYLARPVFEPDPLSAELADTIRRLADARRSAVERG